MCRKHSGSLLPQNCGFPKSNITPALSSNASYQTYASSANASRGFCSTCGSALTFHDTSEPDIVQINLGAFDEYVLCGKRDEENAWEDEMGRHIRRIGGWGKILGNPRYHIYSENEIPGVTDAFEGEKWLLDKEVGRSFRGKIGNLIKNGGDETGKK